MLHQFKRDNTEFKKKYYERINELPIRIQLSHGIAPVEYKMQIKKLREEGKTNAEVAKIMKAGIVIGNILWEQNYRRVDNKNF